MTPSFNTYRVFATSFAAVLLLSLGSCSKDDDTSSDMSQLTAEMCMASTGDTQQIVSAVTDADVKLAFTQPLSASWAQKGDSVYRSLIYYNKVSEPSAAGKVKPLRADRVYVLTPKNLADAKKWSGEVDPLGLTSAWFSKNGKYLNLQLAFKNGTSDTSTQSQTIGMVCDTTIVSAKGKRQYCHLCHNQNGVPTYYTVDVYASVTTDSLAVGDTLTIAFPLWDGTVQKDFIK